MANQDHARDHARVDDLIRRIERIEHRLGIVEPAMTIPPMTAPPPAVPASAPPAERSGVPVPAPRLREAQAPSVQAPAPARANRGERAGANLSVANAPAATRRTFAASAEGRSLESVIGGRWFGVLGAVIVLVGIGLFLKFAYDHGWIGPLGQCLTVAGFGAALMSAGEFIRRRVGRLASIGPSAAGLGALFFAAFAAHEVFELVSVEAAMGLMIGVTVLGIAVAALARLASLAGVAMLGGYLAPVLLASGRPSELFMPSYLVGLLAVGAGLSAWFSARPEAQHFRALRTLGWWGTVLLGTLWLDQTGLSVPPNALLFVAGVWAIVHGEMLLASYAPVRVRPELVEQSEHADVPGLWRARWVAGSFTTSAWTAVFGVELMSRVNPTLDWVGAAGVALLCASAAGLALTIDPIPDVLRRGARTAREQLGAALLAETGALAIVTVALALGGWAQVVAWLALGAAAVGAGRWIRAGSLHVYGLIVLSIAAVRLMTLDLWGAFHSPVAWDVAGLALTAWTAKMGLAALAWMAAGVLMISERRQAWGKVGVAAACAGCALLALAPLHAETTGGSMAVWACVVGVAAVGAGRLRGLGGLMGFGAALLCVGAVRLVVADMATAWNAEPLTRPLGLWLTAWSGRMGLAWAAWALAAILTCTKRWKWAPGLARFLAGGALVLAALAPVHSATDYGALTLWCAALALGAAAAHRFERRLWLDAIGVGMLMAAVLPWMYAYLRDGWTTIEAPAALHPGLGVALILVVAAGLLGALVKRGAERESDRWAVGTLGQIYAGALLFAATSLEVGRVAGILFADDETSRAAVLSIWWGLYGVGVLAWGFARRTAPVRFVGLGLIGLAAVKAVAFDLAQVSEGWRVASFIGLGLLMLGVAVGYSMLARLLAAPGAGVSGNGKSG